MRQDECVTLTSLTRSIADSYKEKLPDVKEAFDNLQLRRLQLQNQATRSPTEESELEGLRRAEPTLSSKIDGLPGELPEPRCPSMRQEYVPPAE